MGTIYIMIFWTAVVPYFIASIVIRRLKHAKQQYDY